LALVRKGRLFGGLFGGFFRFLGAGVVGGGGEFFEEVFGEFVHLGSDLDDFAEGDAPNDVGDDGVAAIAFVDKDARPPMEFPVGSLMA